MSLAPFLKRLAVGYSHRRRKPEIEIALSQRQPLRRIDGFVTGRARRRSGLYATVLRVAGETGGVACGIGFERPLLQPEGVLREVRGRLCDELFIRLALRLVRLMTGWAGAVTFSLPFLPV